MQVVKGDLALDENCSVRVYKKRFMNDTIISVHNRLFLNGMFCGLFGIVSFAFTYKIGFLFNCAPY